MRTATQSSTTVCHTWCSHRSFLHSKICGTSEHRLDNTMSAAENMAFHHACACVKQIMYRFWTVMLDLQEISTRKAYMMTCAFRVEATLYVTARREETWA